MSEVTQGALSEQMPEPKLAGARGLKVIQKDIERFGHTIVGCTRCEYMLEKGNARGGTVAHSEKYWSTVT